MYGHASLRIWFSAGMAFCALVLARALWLELVDGLEPCPMCMLQRLIYLALATFCLGGAIAGGNSLRIARDMSVGLMAVALLGIGVAIRQLYLQSLPPEARPDTCMGMSFYFIAGEWPILDVIATMFEGSKDCGEVLWRFLGISIPGWSLVGFIALSFLGWMTFFISLRQLGMTKS